jgi:hypothetical protein
MAAEKLTARQQFVAEIDGATVVVIQGARFPVASVIVKQYPEMFEGPITAAKSKR